MDQISIISLIFVSFPEGLVVAVLGILLIGKFYYLRDKENIIRLAVFGLLYAISSYFIRRFAQSVIENSLIYLFIVFLSFVFILKLKFYESIMASLLGLFIGLFVLQTVSLLPLLAFTNIDLNTAYLDDTTRILLTLPERFLEIILIFICYRYKLRIIDFDNTNVNKKEYLIQLFVYLVSIMTLVFLTIVMANMIFFNKGNFINESNTLLLRINIYLTLFVTIILTLAIKSLSEHYKNKSKLTNNEFLQSLEYLSKTIDQNSIDEAKEILHTMKVHIKKS